MVLNRSACDRCKAQRLRCLRAKSSTNPCARCVRAKVKCETGPMKPIGRPRKATAISSASIQADQAPLRTNSDHISQTKEQGPHLADSVVVSQSVEALMIWSPCDQIVDNSIGPGATHSPTDVNNALYSNSIALTTWNHSGDAQPFLEEVSTPELVSFPEVSEAVNQQHSIPSHTRLVDDNAVHWDLEPRMGTDALDILRTCDRTTYSKYEDELNQLATLSRLSERASKAAFYLTSLTGEPPISPEPCIMLMERPDTNPIAEALVCSEEFIKGVKCLISPSHLFNEPSSSSASKDQVGHLKNKQEFPSVPIILLLLSIYSQLRKLYDMLFCHIHRSLNEFSNDVLRSTRISSVVRIGALPLMHDMQANLYTWMIVDIMQGNTQNMDYHMGLLAKYCHSFPNTLLGGLFMSEDLNTILQRILEQADKNILDSGGACVDSLQRNIRKVLERLTSI